MDLCPSGVQPPMANKYCCCCILAMVQTRLMPIFNFELPSDCLIPVCVEWDVKLYSLLDCTTSKSQARLQCINVGANAPEKF